MSEIRYVAKEHCRRHVIFYLQVKSSTAHRPGLQQRLLAPLSSLQMKSPTVATQAPTKSPTAATGAPTKSQTAATGAPMKSPTAATTNDGN